MLICNFVALDALCTQIPVLLMFVEGFEFYIQDIRWDPPLGSVNSFPPFDQHTRLSHLKKIKTCSQRSFNDGKMKGD